MLAIRFALVASLGAIALWGLFSLLDNLKEPELLRSARLVVVKGCDVIETDQARQTCGRLRCQKALLDAKLVPLPAEFEITAERVADPERLITGQVKTASSPLQHFACILDDDEVADAGLTTTEEQAALLDRSEGWELASDR